MRGCLLVLLGCAEHTVSSDELERPFEGPGGFGLRVTTEPEAWPEELYDDAVRAWFHGPGTLTTVDQDRDLLQGSPRWVNVLDAFDDCPRDEVCVREFWYVVACEGGCAGRLSADVFLAEFGLDGPHIARGGPLRLEWIDASGGDEDPVIAF